ncbi:glycosyltransferase [Salibacterium halotolerans]|uniref:Glycosyltransferase involved in cell wall bisynthesis n=1 Tax=Salibacterium halotolerans TaxID=1884432 RepID=A0A1I5XWG4_9BACI|nr:glycosyltransferase [Salibacterium halotolerans]SFQ36067.1 Glycosyltransferase involved in cell wall bisynthesis [Salibacterium halotolerans]
MKICFLAGASSIHTVRWVNAMAERGHEVFLITMHPPELDKIDAAVKLYLLRFKSTIGYYINDYKVKRLLRRIKPDLVNTHYASGYGTISRFVHYYPTLLSVWGSDVYDFPYQSQTKKTILVKNLKAATQIASTSWAMKKQTETLLDPELPIEVTPFGIDTDVFKPAAEKANDNIVTIGTVKKLEEKYGGRYILYSAAQLIERLKKDANDNIADKIRVLIVGDGSQEQELKKLAQTLGIDNITSFTGAVPHYEVPNYLNELDIYCAPSTNESFGVAVIEASACGVPVIVSDVGGLPEVVQNGDTGYVIPSKDTQALAEKLELLTGNGELRKSLGENGRQHVVKYYNWEDNVTKMENVYKNLMNKTVGFE